VLRVPVFGPDRLQITRDVSTSLRALFTWADVLHFHDLRFGLDLLARARTARAKPRVLSTHGLIFHTDDDARVKRVLWQRVLLPTLRTFDAVLADSEADFHWVSGLPRARLLENPVDVTSFLSIARAPAPLDGPLLYFGRVAPNKGLETLPDLLRLDPTLRLVVTGGGDPEYVAALEAQFHGLAATFTGEVDAARLDEQLRSCRAIVLPSRAEGFGLTLVEAMATGRPVLASDIPPYRAIARATAVALVDFDDPEAVLARLAAPPTRFDLAATVTRARSYSWETRAHEFADLYRSLAASGHRSRA
jgi:glycosyltransferase involved in cell wall biosynthesis